MIYIWSIIIITIRNVHGISCFSTFSSSPWLPNTAVSTYKPVNCDDTFVYWCYLSNKWSVIVFVTLPSNEVSYTVSLHRNKIVMLQVIRTYNYIYRQVYFYSRVVLSLQLYWCRLDIDVLISRSLYLLYF